MTENILNRWFNPSTCSEKKLNKTKNITSEGVCLYAWSEIPIYTRIDIQIPNLVFILKGQKHVSLHKVEIETKELSLMTMNPQVFIVPCYTPLTHQLIGHVYLKTNPNERKDNKISIIHPLNISSSEDANCMIITDAFHDWNLMVYTTRHISKGEKWKLDVHASKLFPSSSIPCVYLRSWLPSSSIALPKLESFLLSQTNWKERTSMKNLSWNEMILAAAIDILCQATIENDGVDHQHSIDNMINQFNQLFTPNRDSEPLIRCCVLIEGLYNGDHCYNWYTQFVIKAVMSESAYAQ